MKVAIGSLEIEVPKATLGKAKRLAALLSSPLPENAAEALDRPALGILLLVGDANPGLTCDAILDQITVDDGAAMAALRTVAVASGAWKAEAPGESGRP